MLGVGSIEVDCPVEKDIKKLMVEKLLFGKKQNCSVKETVVNCVIMDIQIKLKLITWFKCTEVCKQFFLFVEITSTY